MRRSSTTPRITDLIPALQGDASGATDAEAQRGLDSTAASYDASKIARQLNVRVPVELYSDLLRAQATLMVDLGAKPSIQTLLTACLRLGLADDEALRRAVVDSSGGARSGAAREGDSG